MLNCIKKYACFARNVCATREFADFWKMSHFSDINVTVAYATSATKFSKVSAGAQRLSCQISIAEQWKPVRFRGLNTAHSIFTILKGHCRNTCQMCRAGQIKFAVFRLQNIFSSFSVVIWHPSDTATVALKSTVLEYVSNEVSVSATVAVTAVYGVMSHLHGGRCSPFTSTVALKWQNCNGDACNGLYERSCNQD